MNPPQIKDRYSRQVLLSEIGKEGQERLGKKKVVIVGLGAIGTVTAELLMRAGVENLTIIDRDVVEESNLQRQMLFVEEDVGRSKAIAIKQRLNEINASGTTAAYAIHLNPQNISIIGAADLVLDCTDNIQTRFLINDFCRQQKIPWVYGAAIKTSGYVMPILPEGPCLRCFMSETSLETCDTVGVLNTITTAIAGIQATVAIKLLIGNKVDSCLIHYDIWKQNHTPLRIKQRSRCPTCQGNYEYLRKSQEIKTIQFCSSGRYQIKDSKIDYDELCSRWKKLGEVIEDETTLRFRNIVLFEDGRALIKADSAQEALNAYSKYVGN